MAARDFFIKRQLETSPYPLGPFVGPCDLIFLAAVTTGTAEVSVNFDIIEVPTS